MSAHISADWFCIRAASAGTTNDNGMLIPVIAPRSKPAVEAEKPSFLGEPSLPPQFETLVRKIEAGENGERQGYEAVKRAIVGSTPDAPPIEMQRPATTSPLRPRIPKRPL